MEVILDTNALSAWLDGDPEIKSVLSVVTRVWLSPIVLGEYRFGVLVSKRRREYEDWLALIQNDLAILAVDTETAVHYASVRQELKANGTPIPWHDVWIAAQLRQYRCSILSRDSHFDLVGGITRVAW